MPRETPGNAAAEAAAYDRYFRDTAEAYIGDYAFFRTEPGIVAATDSGSRTCTATVAGVSVDGIEYGRQAPGVGEAWYVTRTSKGNRWLKNLVTGASGAFTITFKEINNPPTSPALQLQCQHWTSLAPPADDEVRLWIYGGAFTLKDRHLIAYPEYDGPSAFALETGIACTAFATPFTSNPRPSHFVADDAAVWCNAADDTFGHYVHVGNAPFAVHSFAVDILRPLTIYACSTVGSVAMSDDGGVTWATTGSFTAGADPVGAFLSPAQNQLVALIANGTWAVSKDDGVTWETHATLAEFSAEDDFGPVTLTSVAGTPPVFPPDSFQAEGTAGDLGQEYFYCRYDDHPTFGGGFRSYLVNVYGQRASINHFRFV